MLLLLCAAITSVVHWMAGVVRNHSKVVRKEKVSALSPFLLFSPLITFPWSVKLFFTLFILLNVHIYSF